MRLPAIHTVDGRPLLGTYAASKLEDLELVKGARMNVVIGGAELLDLGTPEGGFLRDNEIRVLYHLTQHIYGMPTLGDSIAPDARIIPLSNRPARPLPDSGVVLIEEELVRYEEYTPTALQGCERGCSGTEPASHYEGIFLFMPERCAQDIRAVKDSPNLLGYYVLDDSPGDALSALKGIYSTICREEGPDHHVVAAGYGSYGSPANFAPGVCDLMLIYWYPVSTGGYDRLMIGRNVQWMLTCARARVPGIPFAGVYQAFGGDGAGSPSPLQIRLQMEDFVREGACGLIAFACRVGRPLVGWSDDPKAQNAIRKANIEILKTGGLKVRPQPAAMRKSRIQPLGHWQRPREIPGLVPAWFIVGPFDDRDHLALGTVHPPEKELNPSATYEGRPGPVHWIKRSACAGFVGLGELYGDQAYTANAIAYGTCQVTSPRSQKVKAAVGSDDDIQVWLDGREIWRHEGSRGLEPDHDRFNLQLPQGTSTILVKVCNRKGMWGYFMRFLDLKGWPLKGLKFSPGGH